MAFSASRATRRATDVPQDWVLKHPFRARCFLTRSYINQLRDCLEPISRVPQKERPAPQIDDEPHSHRMLAASTTCPVAANRDCALTATAPRSVAVQWEPARRQRPPISTSGRCPDRDRGAHFSDTRRLPSCNPIRRSVARQRPTCQDRSRQAITRVGRYRRATGPDRNSWRSTSSSWMRSRRPASNVGPCPARTG